MKKQLLYSIFSLVLLSFVGVSTQEDRWKAPEKSKELKNPIAASAKAQSAKRGSKIFKTRCMICHGMQGTGNGIGGKALNPKPQNLTLHMVQSQTDGEIFWKITNGRNDMIKWGPILSEDQRWDLVNYVRTLK